MSADLRSVVVTGAGGFLGRHVVRVLEAAGLHVVTVDRARLIGDLEGFLRTVTAGERDGTVGLVHLAAAGVSPRTAEPTELRAINVELPERVIRAAAGAGVARVLTVGTAAEYGRSGDAHERIPPDAALRPGSDYARSKVDGFMRAASAALRTGLGLHHARVFNAFGPGQHERALWAALERAARSGQDLDLSSGTQVRDFIPVADAARALTATLHEPIDPGSVMVRNVGTGEGRTVRAFAEEWWGLLGATGSLRFAALADRTDEPDRLVADPDGVVLLSGPDDLG